MERIYEFLNENDLGYRVNQRLTVEVILYPRTVCMQEYTKPLIALVLREFD